jgi:hypothetical protein
MISNIFDDPFTPTHNHDDSILHQALFPGKPCQIITTHQEYQPNDASIFFTPSIHEQMQSQFSKIQQKNENK